jgi:polar amino acid transport system permease protein
MFWTVTLDLLEAFGSSLQIFFVTLIGAIPLGLVIALGSMTNIKPIAYVTRTFVWIIRGTPLLLQLLIVFHGPGLLFGSFPLTGQSRVLFATFTTFIINYACYFSEIYRGGIESIARGQFEAGQVLGMTRTQTFFRVILLQSVKRIIPPMSNEIITLVKDTALARIIVYKEILYIAEEYATTKGGIIWPLFYSAVYYLAFTALLTLLFRWLEKKLDYFKA